MTNWRMRSNHSFMWIISYLLLLITTVSGKCRQNGRAYQVGQIWFPDGSGQCKQCRCDQGDHVVCRSVCKGRFPPDILIQDGVTTDSIENDANQLWKRPCTLEGKTYSDGTTWQETGPHSKRLRPNECMECNCASQVVTCAIRTCPRTQCKNPVHHEGTCCKLCPEKSPFRPPRDSGRKGCTSIGRQFKDGYHWQLYLPSKNVFTACFSCTCQNGKESCRKHVCPRPSCSKPIREPGSCCASCKGEEMLLSFRGRVQENDNSTVEGFRPIPILTERTTVAMSNQRQAALNLGGQGGIRSPRRKIGERDCMFGRNQVYKDNESFHPILEPFGRQKCTKCVCSNRMIKCGRIRCPSIYPCSNPKTKANLCCKVCPAIKSKVLQLYGHIKRSSLESAEYVLRVDQRKREAEAINTGTEDKEAHDQERIQMYRTKGCTRVRKSHIQVYKYNNWRPEQLILTKRYLFDRTFLRNGKTSEMHTIEAMHNKIRIKREKMSKSQINKIFLDSKWEYIGSVKERVYMRFMMGEIELESCRIGLSCIRRLEQIRQHLESRASRRRQCRSSSVMQSLQRLQEAG